MDADGRKLMRLSPTLNQKGWAFNLNNPAAPYIKEDICSHKKRGTHRNRRQKRGESRRQRKKEEGGRTRHRRTQEADGKGRKEEGGHTTDAEATTILKRILFKGGIPLINLGSFFFLYAGLFPMKAMEVPVLLHQCSQRRRRQTWDLVCLWRPFGCPHKLWSFIGFGGLSSQIRRRQTWDLVCLWRPFGCPHKLWSFNGFGGLSAMTLLQ